MLVGRENPNENDTLDVVAIRRYDRNWTLVGTAYVQGGASQGVKGIYSPFAFSAAHMVLVGNRLVVHMGRLIYVIEGLHHQVNLTLEVDVDNMTATTFDRLGDYAYCSHSFQQLVAMNGSNLVTIDHGDAYPRAIQMGVMAGYPTQRRVSTYDLFEFNGAEGNDFTYAAVTGLVSGPSGIVVVGNSIRHPDAPNGTLGSADEHRNIYAIWADPATGAHTVRWLTDFAPQGADDALDPRVVQVGPNRHAVLFSVQNASGYRMEYRFIDSAGTVLASKSFPGVFFCAGSAPIMIGNTVYWAGVAPDSWDSPEPYYLFGVDVSDPTTPILLSSILDTVAPSTTISGVPSGWTNAGVTFSLASSDNSGGSGVKAIYYTANGSQSAYSGPVSVSTEGVTTVTYWAVDNSNNAEGAKSTTIRIDKTAPATSDDHIATYAGSATIHLSASDARSSVAHTYYTLNGLPQTEGSVVAVGGANTYTLTYWSVDVAGNAEAPHTVTFTVSLPRAAVYTPVAPSTMYRGHSYTIYGYVAPRHTSGTYLATLKFYLRNSHGVYVVPQLGQREALLLLDHQDQVQRQGLAPPCGSVEGTRLPH